MYSGPCACNNKTMKTIETLLPLRTAARLTGLKPQTLREEVRAGRLPGVKVGTEYLYPLNAIRAALLTRVKAAAPDGPPINF